MVNVAFGVVSRAAPTLNLFAVGFPIAMFMGFLIMLVSITDMYPIWMRTVTGAFDLMRILAGGG